MLKLQLVVHIEHSHLKEHLLFSSLRVVTNSTEEDSYISITSMVLL